MAFRPAGRGGFARGRPPPVAVTLGDPGGIGPEVVVHALARAPFLRSRALVIGDPAVVSREVRRRGFDSGRWVRRLACPEQFEPRHFGLQVIGEPVHRSFRARRVRPNAAAGRMSAEWLAIGCRLSMEGRVSALVTGPVSKEAVARSHPRFRGQTEFIAEVAGVDFPVMMLAGRTVRVIPVTRHLPLARVPRAVTRRAIVRTLVVADRGLRSWFGVRSPLLAVCGLNPHAGEGGLLGAEEARVIAPAVREARRRGIHATGPWPADAVFTPAARARYDAVVTMYHDQANVPIKALEFERTINVTLGLPFLRTSPGHGTAFDIAGRRVADCTSMHEAIETAVKSSRARR